MDVSSRDRPTLTASVEEGCEIHKPNNHNQSRQQQPPHKQTRKHHQAILAQAVFLKELPFPSVTFSSMMASVVDMPDVDHAGTGAVRRRRERRHRA